MSPMRSVAFIGNHLPRRCGIATFTHDLHHAVAAARADLDTCVVAMNDPGNSYSYPPAVRFQIRDEIAGDYRKAAAFLNGGDFDVACLQHEYGIFGGEAGSNILELLPQLEMPIVTTLHTILAAPSPAQRAVMDQIIDVSSKLVVMSDKGRQFLRTVHGVPASKIEIIPHGIPEYPFIEPQHAKAKFGFSGQTVILTFGLLSPSKGIETVIDAMPAIIESCPNAVYVVLGATHPNLVRDQGEAYRESLSRARPRARHRRSRRVLQPVRRPGDAARLHLDVRCLRHAVSQRSANDLGHARLQLRPGQGRGVNALLARAGAAGRWTRHPRAVRRFGGDRRRDLRPADQRRSPPCHAQAGVPHQPVDGMGARSQRATLRCSMRHSRPAAPAEDGRASQ